MKVRVKAQPLPLTRRERKALAEARSYGLAAFGDSIATEKTAAKALATFTDNQRQYFFAGLEDYCDLTESLRGEN